LSMSMERGEAIQQVTTPMELIATATARSATAIALTEPSHIIVKCPIEDDLKPHLEKVGKERGMKKRSMIVGLALLIPLFASQHSLAQECYDSVYIPEKFTCDTRGSDKRASFDDLSQTSCRTTTGYYEKFPKACQAPPGKIGRTHVSTPVT